MLRWLLNPRARLAPHTAAFRRIHLAVFLFGVVIGIVFLRLIITFLDLSFVRRPVLSFDFIPPQMATVALRPMQENEGVLRLYFEGRVYLIRAMEDVSAGEPHVAEKDGSDADSSGP